MTYKAYEESCLRNSQKVFHNRNYEEWLREIKKSGERYGQWFLREHTGEAMDKWKTVTEEPRAIEYVPRLEDIVTSKDIGIIIPTQPYLTIYGSIYRMNINNVGKFISLWETWRQLLMDYLRSEEGQALMVFLEEKGYKPKNVDALGVGFLPSKSVAAIGLDYKGRLVILRNKDFYELVNREVEILGKMFKFISKNPELAKELIIRATLGEEITHLYTLYTLKNGNGLAYERLAKELLKEFYETMAKELGKEGKDYEILEKIMEHEVETFEERYKSLNENELADEAVNETEGSTEETELSSEEV